MMIEMAAANTGRSMKKWEILMRAGTSLRPSRRKLDLAVLAARDAGGEGAHRRGLGVDLAARPRPLHAADDHPVRGRKAGADHPHAVDEPADLDGALAHHPVGGNHVYDPVGLVVHHR